MKQPEQLKKSVQLRLKTQRVLVRSLLALREQLPGSLFERYGCCGKEGCACKHGPGHGPYYVLSNRSQGQGHFDYLQPGQVRQARQLVSRHREFRAGLKQLKRLNTELLSLLARYQSAMARQGRLRLPLADSRKGKN